jgi:hypothetical protein
LTTLPVRVRSMPPSGRTGLLIRSGSTYESDAQKCLFAVKGFVVSGSADATVLPGSAVQGIRSLSSDERITSGGAFEDVAATTAAHAVFSVPTSCGVPALEEEEAVVSVRSSEQVPPRSPDAVDQTVGTSSALVSPHVAS